MRYLLVVAAVLGLVAIGSANSFAATGSDPIYMQFGTTIKGDVTAQGYDQWIALDSFQFGVEKPVTFTSSGTQAGAPKFSDITITKQMDKSSPQLLQEMLAPSAPSPVVKIDFVRTLGTGQPVTYAEYTLTNPIITGYSTSSGGSLPTESITIAFTKITYSFTPMTLTGVLGSPITVGWDLAQNRLA